MNNSTDERQDKDKSKRKGVSLWKGLGYLGYLICSVAILLLLIEGGLWIAFLATRNDSLQPLDAAADENGQDVDFAYPDAPDEYLKFAVFGGSAAGRAYTPRSFDEVLAFELRKQFPDKEFLFKNYAASGYPFHRHQAEYVKSLIDKYDFFIIYCGNNESSNWFDDTGFGRDPEYKNAKELVYRAPPEAQSKLRRQLTSALEKYSRLYTIATNAKSSLSALSHPLEANLYPDFGEFEPAGALPPEEAERLVKNFEEDVIEINELAEQHGKQVLLAVTATSHTWPPGYSYFRNGITDAEKQQWELKYQAGLVQFQKGNYESAISRFLEARDMDPGVAILNYRLGTSYQSLGNTREARRFLRMAIDQDGMPTRSISALHQKAEQLGDQHERLHYVDVDGAFHAAIEDGLTDDELFEDICHPSFLGHVLMGQTFLAEVLKLEPFCSSVPPAESTATSIPDWRSMARQYELKLGVTSVDWATVRMDSILWQFELANFTAYPKRCFDEIQKHIEQLESQFAVPDDRSRANDSRTNKPLAFAILSRARLALIRGDYGQATEQLNQAFDMAPAEVLGILNVGAWNHRIQAEFEKVGIVRSTHDGRFVRHVTTPTNDS